MISPAVELARSEGKVLVVETGNGTMVNSNYTAKLLIEQLDAKDILKVLWDPGNNCWYHEVAFPDGYNEIRDRFIGHIHIKDVLVDIPRAKLEVKKTGTGQLGKFFNQLLKPSRKIIMVVSSHLKVSTTLAMEILSKDFVIA